MSCSTCKNYKPDLNFSTLELIRQIKDTLNATISDSENKWAYLAREVEEISVLIAKMKASR